jgi:hypothetical protein
MGRFGDLSEKYRKAEAEGFDMTSGSIDAYVAQMEAADDENKTPIEPLGEIGGEETELYQPPLSKPKLEEGEKVFREAEGRGKKNIVVFAETPYTYEYSINDNIDELPKELAEIKRKENKLFDKWVELKRTGDKEKADEVYQERSKLRDKFDKHPKNNKKEQNQTFVKEANNLKEVYKNDPNVNVDVIPVYGDKNKIKETVKGLKKDDTVVLTGHADDKLFGINNEEIADILDKSDVGSVHIGSCSFEDEGKIGCYKKLSKNKDVYYRPGESWWGINPRAKGFLDAMYGRRMNPESGEVEIMPPEEGVSYRKLIP